MHEEDGLVCSAHHTHLPKYTTAHTHNHCALTGAGYSESTQQHGKVLRKNALGGWGTCVGIQEHTEQRDKEHVGLVSVNPLEETTLKERNTERCVGQGQWKEILMLRNREDPASVGRTLVGRPLLLKLQEFPW